MMADAKEFQSELDVLLSTYPKLQSINDNDKLSLFRMWYDKADRTKLLSMLNDQPQWMAVGWSVVARHHAQNGDFRSACKLGFEKITPPISTPPSANVDIDQLTRLFLLSPTDISRGLQLYESLKFKERDDEALRVLDDLAKLPSVPNKVLYEKAFILNRKKEYSKSWDALQQYMNALE